MALSQEQRGILAAVASFGNISRYQGLMPAKHTTAFGSAAAEELQTLGLIEEVEITFGCGKMLKGFRLTAGGRRALDAAYAGGDEQEQDELGFEHLVLLVDTLHFCAMPRYRFMLPAKKARAYAADDLEDLVNRGYLLKLAIANSDKGKYSGFIISSKGKQALARAGMA